MVSQTAASHGCYVIDADVLSCRAVEKGTDCLNAIVERFSSSVLRGDGTLNRKALAEKAFATAEETAALNAIVHPAVCRMIREELNAAQGTYPVAVIDAPLLFEAAADALCHETVAVLAEKEQRLSRICARDGLSKEQALLRMNAQPTDDFYRDRASMVLYNNGDLTALQEQAEIAVKRWKEKADA